eukprot:CAMPEP_0198208196 /NCGR_PEP_ID=MMETSP1445-20131203/11596_1 /TAXON_ID=36898 /ORGANISM="Pyramimonas sp., Strain CCMP2087" /LENGTH=68 /DNA_ID=CAMNT_0043881505 /DNA_START=52 /DNA_END=258 /DNA_ORIENTATION=+
MRRCLGNGPCVPGPQRAELQRYLEGLASGSGAGTLMAADGVARASWRRSVEAAVNKVELAWQANNVDP